jgi:hypothetical protein
MDFRPLHISIRGMNEWVFSCPSHHSDEEGSCCCSTSSTTIAADALDLLGDDLIIDELNEVLLYFMKTIVMALLMNESTRNDQTETKRVRETGATGLGLQSSLWVSSLRMKR